MAHVTGSHVFMKMQAAAVLANVAFGSIYLADSMACFVAVHAVRRPCPGHQRLLFMPTHLACLHTLWCGGGFTASVDSVTNAPSIQATCVCHSFPLSFNTPGTCV